MTSDYYTRWRNKQHLRFQLRNISLLVLLVGVCVYLLDGRKNTQQQQVMHQVVTSASTIVRDGVVLPTNDCLVQLGNVKGIKLYSQNDEDGALLQVLRCMGGHGTKEYFEFGSENGSEVNTRILRELYGWHGHLLDGGNEDASIPLHKEWFTPSNIVSLLQKYKVNKNLDVLSIDADYDDLYIMREILVAGYKPRVLITEYNCNFGSEWSVSTVAKIVGKENEVRWNGNCYFGASSTALIKLAAVFGYTPVWANYVNLIFVRIDQSTEMGMIIPAVENYPGPEHRALHSDCSMTTWKRIDDSHLSKATDTTLSHVDFASGFADIKLTAKKYENLGKSARAWRVFSEVK